MLTTATINILSQLESTFTWTTTSTLGPISVYEISDLNVNAELSTSSFDLRYSIKSGSLPPGLTLNFDGTIVGKLHPFVGTPPTLSTASFTVSAKDLTAYEYDSKAFQLEMFKSTSTEYASVYFKPYLTLDKRKEYNKFVENKDIFIPSLIYRPYDLNFGVQKNIKMFLHFGVEFAPIQYSSILLEENFSKRKLRLGNIKTAIAKENNEIIYEIIYLEVIDDYNLNNFINTATSFVFNGKTYYPPSINNMRTRFIKNSQNISTTEDLNPKFTKTIQNNSNSLTGYIPFVPICYCLPGKSSIILKKIKDSKFQFNKINFDIDRILVERFTGDTQYLLFKN